MGSLGLAQQHVARCDPEDVVAHALDACCSIQGAVDPFDVRRRVYGSKRVRSLNLTCVHTRLVVLAKDKTDQSRIAQPLSTARRPQRHPRPQGSRLTPVWRAFPTEAPTPFRGHY